MNTTYMPDEAARWLYAQGAPWAVARAFGDYHAGCVPGMSFTAAKLRFERKHLGGVDVGCRGR